VRAELSRPGKVPCKEAGIPKQDPNAVRSGGMQLVLNSLKFGLRRPFSREFKEPLKMKTIVLTVVLGATLAAMGQNAQPAQGQSAAPAGQAAAAPASQAPVIKDPAEYNAYVAAIQAKDANAKISGLEAFVTQYPNSVMKNQALEVLMGTYQQANNPKKTIETAAKLVAAEPCNERGLALLAYFDRVMAQQGDPNSKQELEDAKKYGQSGLECLPKVTDQELLKSKPQMEGIFHAAIGITDLQDKDYAGAIENLKPAADANPQDFSVIYPLALAYWPDPKVPTPTPDNSLNSIWYAARASAIAPAQAQAQIEKYARSLYVRYHGGDDGWPDVLAKAKAGTAAPPDLATLIKPAPTPADQAHKMVQDTTPDKMDFATWEFVLTNGSQEDQDTVWNAIKGKAVQMVGTVISTEPETFMIAGSSDDIDAKKPDITLKFEEKIPAKMIPKDGDDKFEFQGEPASYTSNPFMMVMEKGELLRAKPAAPAHRSAAKKPAAH
jgi:tetratricopeptide (TPR) repeat protein